MYDAMSVLAGIKAKKKKQLEEQLETTPEERLDQSKAYPDDMGAESSTQAEDEGFGEDKPIDNELPEDQQEARKLKGKRIQDIFVRLDQKSMK